MASGIDYDAQRAQLQLQALLRISADAQRVGYTDTSRGHRELFTSTEDMVVRSVCGARTSAHNIPAECCGYAACVNLPATCMSMDMRWLNLRQCSRMTAPPEWGWAEARAETAKALAQWQAESIVFVVMESRALSVPSTYARPRASGLMRVHVYCPVCSDLISLGRIRQHAPVHDVRLRRSRKPPYELYELAPLPYGVSDAQRMVVELLQDYMEPTVSVAINGRCALCGWASYWASWLQVIVPPAGPGIPQLMTHDEYGGPLSPAPVGSSALVHPQCLGMDLPP